MKQSLMRDVITIVAGFTAVLSFASGWLAGTANQQWIFRHCDLTQELPHDHASARSFHQRNR